jgi:nicotinamidase-related amidase
MKNTALLVIDVQESFVHRPFWSSATQHYLPSYLRAQNELIEGFKELELPIVRVFHENSVGSSAGPFSPGNPLIRPLEGLVPFEAAFTVVKHKHSALVGTNLGDWLKTQSVERLVISGIRTEQCCETTARHASDEGWEIDFALDATLTFEMQNLDGSPLSIDAILQRTASVLSGRFATIVSSRQALERLR